MEKISKVKCPHCNSRFMHTHVCRIIDSGITREYVESYHEDLKLYQTEFDAPIYIVGKNIKDALRRLKNISGDLYMFLQHSVDKTDQLDHNWSLDDIPFGYEKGEGEVPIGAYLHPEKYSDFEDRIEYMSNYQKRKLLEKLQQQLSNV